MTLPIAGGRLGSDRQNPTRTPPPRPRGTVENWLAARLSALDGEDTESEVGSELGPEPRVEPPAEEVGPDKVAEDQAIDQTVEDEYRRGADATPTEFDFEDDAATLHDDSFRAQLASIQAEAAGGHPGRIVARAPVSPNLPVSTGAHRRPSPPDPLDPGTDHFDRDLPEFEDAMGREEGLEWDEVDPGDTLGIEEETGVLLQRTDPSITEDPTPRATGDFQGLPPPPGFLELDLEPGTQWEVDPRRSANRSGQDGVVQEATQIRYTPAATGRIDDDDDEMPTVIAKPGQVFGTPPPAASAPDNEAPSPPPSPPRPPPVPVRPPEARAGNEVVWLASALASLMVLVVLALAAVGWLSLH